MNPDQFAQELSKQNIALTPTQKHQFNKYYQTLVEWNEKMNLTSLTSESDVYLKHFYDSITASFFVDFTNEATICDVGAGAGFPSIPLKICFPHLQVTIVDSLKKRIGFLEHLANKLGLENVTFVHARAEDAGKDKKFREKFDFVTARAVARMSVLSELCLPFCKHNGQFIAMKGALVEEEVNKAENAIQTLGGKTDTVHSFTLPIEDSERSIVLIRKNRGTPKQYPRKAGTPTRNPIV